MAQISMEVPYSRGMSYGRGFDSLTGRIRGFGLQSATEEAVPDAAGQTIKYYLNKVETVQDLEKSLGLQAEVHAQFGLFGASAKFDFAQSATFNSFSVFLVARVEVTNAFRQIVDPKLDAESSQLLKDGNTSRFAEQLGDCYVSGMLTGGEFCAVLELRTETSTDQQELSASLSGSYGIGASGEVDFSSKVRKATTNRFLKISMYQAGGVETSVTNSVDEVLDRAKGYAAGVQQAPVPYSAQILDYGTLDLPPGPSFIETERARLVLLQFARQRTALLRMQNDISYVRENPDQFMDPDLAALNAAAADCAARLNQLTDNAAVAAGHPADAQYLDVGLPVIQLPQRRPGAPAPVVPPGMAVVPDAIGWTVQKLESSILFSYGSHGDYNPDAIVVAINPPPGSVVPIGTFLEVTTG